MNMIVKDYTLIQLIIAELDDFIAKVAIKGSFSSERLKTYLTLHLFKYDWDDIYDIDNREINKKIIVDELVLLIDYLKENEQLYSLLKRMAKCINKASYLKRVKGEIIEIDKDTKQRLGKIYFKPVIKEIGELIDQKIDYMKYQEKVSFRFGLFRELAYVPFAYLSFTELNKSWLKDKVREKTLINNRALSFNDVPENAMSMLYDLCMKYFKEQGDYDSCLISVDPNVKDNKQLFLSDAMISIPVDYGYIDGFYYGRKGYDFFDDKITISKIKPQPLHLFVKDINNK